MLAFTWSNLGDLALAIFLIVLGIGLFWACFHLGALFARLASLVKGAEREALPVIAKVGSTLDRVNAELAKVDVMADSAVDAVVSVDRAVRAVSYGVTTPVQKAVGLVTGVKYGASSFMAKRDWRAAVATAKDAAARRERDFVADLERHGADQGASTPPARSASAPPAGPAA